MQSLTKCEVTKSAKFGIRRPPLDFKISCELENAINRLIDSIESKSPLEGAWAMEVHALSRELKEDSAEEHFIQDYYVNYGWVDDAR